MATQALINIDGVAGPDLDFPIDTIATLTNTGLGGESTWLWEIIDQPPGAADALTTPTAASATLRPKKEGTYYLRLTVNQGMGGANPERIHEVMLGVIELLSGQRLVAAGEQKQGDPVRGWASAVNDNLKHLTNRVSKGITLVGTAGSAGLVKGDVLRATGTTTIKAGLTFPEDLPSFTKMLANSLSDLDEPAFICMGGVDGDTTPANGDRIFVMALGHYGPVTGAGSTGQPVYVDNAGALSLVAGTHTRVVGSVTRASGGTYDVMFGGQLAAGGGGGGGGTVTSVTFGAGITQSGTAADPVGDVVATDDTVTVGANSLGVNMAGTFAWTKGHSWTVSDAVTAAITDVLTIGHRTSGAAAAGYGTGILFTGEDAADGADDMARIGPVWVTAAAGSEASAFVLQLRVAGAALSEVLRVSALGGLVMANTTAGTNAVADMVTITQATSGAAAPGFGSGILLRAENATSPNLADQARISFSWLVATHTAETSFIDVTLREAGTNRSWLSGSLIGTNTLSSFTGNTNTVFDQITSAHRTSGTAAAGFGTGILFTGEDASNGADNMGRMSVLWTTATAGSEASDWTWQTRNAGAALAEVGRFSGLTGVTSTKYGSTGVAGLLMRGEFPVGDGGSGTVQDIAWMKSVIADATNGSEDSTIEFQLRRAGNALATYHTLSHSAGITHLNSTALTATHATGLLLQHKTSGAVATSFGTNLDFQLADNGAISASQVNYARIGATVSDSVSGFSALIFSVVNGSFGTLVERFRTTHLGGEFTNDAAATNAVTDILTLSNIVSGAAANGSGSAILFQSEDSAGNLDQQCRLSSYWTDVTSTSEDSAFKVQLRVGGAALSDRYIIEGGSRVTWRLGSVTAPAAFAGEFCGNSTDHRFLVFGDNSSVVAGLIVKGDDANRSAVVYQDGTGVARGVLTGGTYFCAVSSTGAFGTLSNNDAVWIVNDVEFFRGVAGGDILFTKKRKLVAANQQTTVGAAGGASAMPTPLGYEKAVRDDGTAIVFAYFNA